MLHRFKTTLKEALRPSNADRLRRARHHARGLTAALLPGEGGLLHERPWPEAAAETMRGVAARYRELGKGPARVALLRSLMARVSADVRFKPLLESQHVRSLLDPVQYSYALAAARYAGGDIEGATALLGSLAKSDPSPFASLSLSRCWSHGQEDDRSATTVLTAALQRFPHDLALALSLAAAHFRLGDTAEANRWLESVEAELRRTVGGDDPQVPALAAEIDLALRDKLAVRHKRADQDTYTEASADRYWQLLWYYMNSVGPFQHGWSRLNQLYQQQIGDLLRQTVPTIRTVVNFGVFCAEPDYQLARKFPDTTFIGVDREIRTKQLNDDAYSSPNLRFLAADVLKVLPEICRAGGPVLLFHARTATLCYPEFLKTLYQSCAEAGVAHVALWENNSLCRTTLRFHDFGAMPALSIPYKSVMFIHDYAALLENAGYRTVTMARRPSNLDLLEEDTLLGDGHAFVHARLGSGPATPVGGSPS